MSERMFNVSTNLPYIKQKRKEFKFHNRLYIELVTKFCCISDFLSHRQNHFMAVL